MIPEDVALVINSYSYQRSEWQYASPSCLIHVHRGVTKYDVMQYFLTYEGHDIRRPTTTAKPQTHKREAPGPCLELAQSGRIGVLAGSLGTFAEHLGGLVATNTTAPLATLLIVLVRAAGKRITSIFKD